MLTIGIWDGHDSGAALVQDGVLITAVNEERFSRRKLEVHFPHQSIENVLRVASVTAREIDNIAYCTTDPAKTLTRLLPSLKEEYYQVRRRKRAPGAGVAVKRLAKYLLTELSPNSISRALSDSYISRQLQRHSLGEKPLSSVDHHAAHAAGAAFTSGFSSALVLTLDGVGDGASGSVWRLEDNSLSPTARFRVRDSLGIFFEFATQLLNMRELEDEGKVMALANYASPTPLSENPFLELFEIRKGTVIGRHTSLQLLRKMRSVFFKTPYESFAFFAQQALEHWVLQLVSNLTDSTPRNLAYAGGVAANVRINQRIRGLPGVKELYVFPHMGDGGLAAGAALFHQSAQTGLATFTPTRLKHAALGVRFSEAEIDSALAQRAGIQVTRSSHIPGEVAQLLADGEVVLWFQGGMEYGPRALGSRSILARPDSIALRDQLNLSLKKRVWYQPFCPSMLKEGALEYLDNYHGESNPFMTSAYSVRPQYRKTLEGVIHIDGSCRPQILSAEDGAEIPLYYELLTQFRALTGIGALLNTSFNPHGEPLVCSPTDALRVFTMNPFKFLVLNDRIVSKSVGQ